MYPEMIVMLVILIGFVVFLGYQVFLTLWVYIHKGYSWWYGFKLYSVNMPDLTKSPYYGKNAPKRLNWQAYYPTIDDPMVKNVARQIDLIARSNRLNDTQKANLILKFVQQNIKYVKDKDQYGKEEYWVLPVNTLAKKAGDCEDSAFLCACLMHHCGLDVINVNMVGHMTCAVAVPAFGKKYTLNNTKYYRAETTNAFIQYVGVNLGTDTKLELLTKPEIPTDEFTKSTR